MCLVARTPMVLEVDRNDLPNTVCCDEGCTVEHRQHRYLNNRAENSD